MGKSKISDKAIGMFKDELMSMEQIGRVFGASRTAVKKFLNKHGVFTGKGQFSIICANCGVKVYRPRCQIRGKIHSFCTEKCYFEYLDNPSYQQSRQGQRLARREIEKKFGYMEGYVVHHKDGNDLNNVLGNLMVFKTHSDHMAFHRFREVEALDVENSEWKRVRLSP